MAAWYDELKWIELKIISINTEKKVQTYYPIAGDHAYGYYGDRN